ncbi:hypothetical protein AVEN_130327-1 [Araneus ventricosus]|uniref:Uncharacterized protein n=1 Tax=Araneus ventricosus TaxID=182803 RepID=A0A4Y2BD24_ARAVE|nr:hypothetical protein AVEN_130327-1 [Araneus ventricosus]
MCDSNLYPFPCLPPSHLEPTCLTLISLPLIIDSSGTGRFLLPFLCSSATTADDKFNSKSSEVMKSGHQDSEGVLEAQTTGLLLGPRRGDGIDWLRHRFFY